MWFILTAVGILISAFLAIRTQRLLISAIWLALTSALVALLTFMLGAPQIAVVELSVGAGLVTVLFVFAINISGEEGMAKRPLISRPLSVLSVCTAAALAIYLILRSAGVISLPMVPQDQPEILWNARYLDILLQIALIFSGVLGVIGILSDGFANPKKEENG